MQELESASLLPSGLPFTLTVAEVAEWLRISKGGVYELIHRWLATDGAEGLPIVKLGLDRTWRVPTIAVLRMVGVVDPAPPAARTSARLRSVRPRGDGAA